jgi:hypothetical protein
MSKLFVLLSLSLVSARPSGCRRSDCPTTGGSVIGGMGRGIGKGPPMSMFIWLDYSERERRKMLDVVDLFREHDINPQPRST